MGKWGKKTRKQEMGKIEIAGDFSLIVGPYLWK
jgi:hypothetical protein